MQILLSNSQAGPGRTVKQEQEEISRNPVQAFQPILVSYVHRKKGLFVLASRPGLTFDLFGLEADVFLQGIMVDIRYFRLPAT